MNRSYLPIAAAIALIASLIVFDPFAVEASQVSRSERKVWLDAVAGNVAAGSRTFTMLTSGGSTSAVADSGYNLAVIHTLVDYTSGITEVAMTCSGSDDDSTLFVIQDCDVTSGVCTSSDASWEKAIAAADTNFVWRVDVTGLRYVSCVMTFASGAADDEITVSGYLTTK